MYTFDKKKLWTILKDEGYKKKLILFKLSKKNKEHAKKNKEHAKRVWPTYL